MSDLIRNIIGGNVKKIRKSLNLSQLSFSILTDVSRASIINIESGKRGYNLNLLDNITSFTTYSFQDLCDSKLVVPFDFRDKLLEKYKADQQINSLLSRTPEIIFAIYSKLLPSKFFAKPREVNEIKDFFEKFGWVYVGTSISNSLKSIPNLIQITSHPSKGNTYLYSRKTDYESAKMK